MIRIIKLNEVYIKIDCDDGTSQELREFFTFDVEGAKWDKRFQQKIWDGKLRLYNMRNRTILAGLLPFVEKFCTDREYKYELVDDFNQAVEFSLHEAEEFIRTLNLSDDKGQPLTLYEYQIKAFVLAIRNRRHLFLSPTSSGKSVILYVIFRYLLHCGFTKGLMIIPAVHLIKQMVGDFKDYSRRNGFDVDAHVHMIFEGQAKHSDKSLNISTWQSIYKEDPEFFHDYDFVFGDEAHEFQAKSLTAIMSNLIHASVRIGCTGTLDGTKTHKLSLEGLFGMARRTTTTKELTDAGRVAKLTIKCLHLKYPISICKTYASEKYAKEVAFVLASQRRLEFVRNLALSLKGHTLILFNFVEKHGIPLYEAIKELAGDRPVYIIHGDVAIDDREDIRQALKTETDAIVVASFGTFQRGVNIPTLQNLILASPAKGQIRVLQSIGRLIRRTEQITSVTMFDIIDDMRYKSSKNALYEHFEYRFSYYNQERHIYKFYNIDLRMNDDGTTQEKRYTIA